MSFRIGVEGETLSAQETTTWEMGANKNMNLTASSNTGSISGHVYESNGTTPIPSVRVHVYDPETGVAPVAPVITGQDGCYTISGLSPGNYEVLVEAEGFAYEWFDGAFSKRNAALVSVTAGQETPGIVFSLNTAGSISGRVTDSDGNPVQGVYVEALDTETRAGGGDYTASDGTYTITGLPTGATG